MIELNLNEEERLILKEMVESRLSDIHDEIRRTDNYAYKEMLRKRQSLMSRLLEAIAKEEQPQVSE